MTVDLNTLPCEVCRGTGTTYLEHPDGTLSDEVCPYCKGRKNSLWLSEKSATRENHSAAVKVGIVVYLVALFATNGLPFWVLSAPHPGLVVAHIGAWLLGVGGLVWWYCHPEKGKRFTPKQPNQKTWQPQPNAFKTTEKERLMGGVVLGGALLKAEYQHRHPKQ